MTDNYSSEFRSKFSNIVVLLLLSYLVRKISNFISQWFMPLNEVPDLWSDLWFNLQFRNACVVKDFSLGDFYWWTGHCQQLQVSIAVALDTFLVWEMVGLPSKVWPFGVIFFIFFLIDIMSSPGKDNFRMKSYKNNALNPQEMRRRREEEGIQLRKQKREEQVSILMSC